MASKIQGRVAITANVINRSYNLSSAVDQQVIADTIKRQFKAANWTVVSVVIQQVNVTAQYITVVITCDMYSTLDPLTIQNWAKIDLEANGWSTGAVTARIISTASTATVTPKPQTTTTVVNSNDAALQSIQAELAAIRAGNTPKSSNALNSISSQLGVSAGALAIGGVLVVVAVLVSGRR